MDMDIDLTMTAARRPDLVGTTLRSFHENLFTRLRVRTFFLNIDPVWGDDRQAVEVERIAHSYFRHVVVRSPETPSFGAAVKWLWAQPQRSWFLHLEDDWIISRPLRLERVEREMEPPDVMQIRLANWTRLKRRKKPPYLMTSPSFVRSTFGRMAASVMNPDLDPEKQFGNDTNPTLQKASERCRAVYHGGIFAPQLAFDIGREWRDARQISKQLINGTSVWRTPE